MSFVINTNVMSLVAQQNLSKSNQMLNQAITRLSSGKKINSAADDAAGQAIANRMTAQISGLTQAKSNANDGISLGQTTEGALDQINDNLQRIRKLSVQAANGTNSTSDLKSIQDEINERLLEIDRVSEQTTFNGVNVLSSGSSIEIQVGANDDETITINLDKINQHTLGLANLDMTNQVTSGDIEDWSKVSGTITEAVSAQFADFTFNDGSAGDLSVVVGTSGGLYVKDANSSLYSATLSHGVLSYNTSGTAVTGVTEQANASTFIDGTGNLVQLSVATDAVQDDAASAAAYSVWQGSNGSVYVTVAGATGTGVSGWTVDISDAGQINWSTGVIDVTKATSATGIDMGKLTSASADALLAEVGTAAISVDMDAVDSALSSGINTLYSDADGNYYVANVDGSTTTYYNATLDASDGTVSLQVDDNGAAAEQLVDPLEALDDALSQVDSLRSNLGAMQNRFDSAIANLSTTNTNLKAARSRIVDANYAEVVSQMSKAQILQQAGTSVLAQANASQQSVLSLLR